jgi:hypothetical protein
MIHQYSNYILVEIFGEGQRCSLEVGSGCYGCNRLVADREVCAMLCVFVFWCEVE